MEGLLMLNADSRHWRIAREAAKAVGAMLAVQGVLVFFDRTLSARDFVLVTLVIVIVRSAVIASQWRKEPAANPLRS